MPVLALALLLISALCAAPAHASPLFELVGGVGEQAGLNGRAAGPSAASTYFNPALLPKAEPGFVTGVLILNDEIGVSLGARDNVDVPLEYRNAIHANGSVFERPTVPTSWLAQGCAAPQCPLPLAPRPRQAAGSSGQTHAYESVGLTTQLLGPRLVLGFYGLIPLADFTTAHAFYVDEREQFFSNSLHPELYSDRLTATSMAFGLGSQILRRLSVGASFTLGLRNSANAGTFVGNADDLAHTLLLSTDVGVRASISPHFGVSYDVTDDLHLSGTLHSEQRFDITTAFSTFLPNGNKQLATRTTVHDYLPWQIGFGASYDVISKHAAATVDAHQLSLVATALVGLWSSYIDRQGERPLPGYEWSNTLGGGGGVRHSYGPVRSFVDVTYVPTPVPPQTGRSNYVDNNRVSASVGIDYKLRVLELDWRVGLQAQAHWLLPRAQQKLDPLDPRNRNDGQLVRDEFPNDAVDTRGRPIASAAGLQTNNPGWPGFSSAGVLLGGGVTLALLF